MKINKISIYLVIGLIILGSGCTTKNQNQQIDTTNPVAASSISQEQAAVISEEGPVQETEPERTFPEMHSFTLTVDPICTEDGKPIVRLFSTTWCPHCKWVKDTFDQTVTEYAKEGKIIARHWEVDINDDSLTEEKEGEIPQYELDIFLKANPRRSIPTFVFGCKYVRVGNAFERQNDLKAEKELFKQVIEELLQK
ncbi:MAG: thioredoxin family protein [Candidatus Altiarchaeota archaeon]